MITYHPKVKYPLLLMVTLLVQVSMFRRRGGRGTGKGAAFEHFCCPLSGKSDQKFCPMLRTFEFGCAEDWDHLKLTVRSTRS